MMLFKLLSFMDRSQFENVVISLNSMAIIGEKIQALGIPVYYLQEQQFFALFVSPIKFIRISRKFNPDVLMGWMYHANLGAFFIKCFLRKPVVLTWNIRHSLSRLGYEKRLTQIVIKIGAFLSQKRPVIIFNSVTSQQQHRRYGFLIQESLIIPNGFDTSIFIPSAEKRSEIRKRLFIKDDDILIGHIGRYHPMKDHSRFIAAAEVLSKKNSKIQFVMIGRGVSEQNHKIMDQIIELGIRNRFHLLGERQDIHTILPSFDIFVSTSAWGEAFPNVIGEAMACGIPCVATDVGDTPMIVGETGIIVPPHDTDAIINGISDLIEMGNEKRHELGMKARLRVTKKFGIAAITRQYETLFSRPPCNGSATGPGFW